MKTAWASLYRGFVCGPYYFGEGEVGERLAICADELRKYFCVRGDGVRIRLCASDDPAAGYEVLSVRGYSWGACPCIVIRVQTGEERTIAVTSSLAMWLRAAIDEGCPYVTLEQEDVPK